MALPEDKSPASIALRVIETHKPPNRDKVAPPGEVEMYVAAQMFVMVDYVREVTVKKSCKYGANMDRLSICSS